MTQHDRPQQQLILLVDDDREIVQALSIRLRSEGYNILEAYDGETGLTKAIERHPDAIVLDIRMPGMDGLSMLRKLQENEDICEVPTIVLSANIAEQVRAKALQLRARYFIEKPYKSETLVVAIQSVLGKNPTYADKAAVD